MTVHPRNARCLVIGVSSGIGRAVVERFRATGCEVVTTSRSRACTTGPAPATGKATHIELDVRDAEALVGAVDEAATAMDGLDVLVYCPGVAHVGPIESVSPQQWSEIFDVNTRGFGLAVTAALPYWHGGTGGCAVAISSQAARRGQALIGAYTASKAALDGLVRALAVELGAVARINAVAPGVVPTEMIKEDFRRQAIQFGESVETIEERALLRIPTKRFQDTTAIAAAVVFLTSVEAAHITGQTLAVDGGMTA